MPGPLSNLKVVEFAGIGPGPFCAMLLADLGAKVLRIDRREPSGLGVPKPPRYDLLLRSRKILALDLKKEAGLALATRLTGQADAVIEGFRPGVMERLGLGPEALIARNPRLVFGRITGWGQSGPLAQAAGHDLNYIAVSGALNAIGRAGGPPTPPLNVVGDYAAAVYLAFGLVSAVLKARESGQGQVVDAAICETTAHLMTSFFGQHAGGLFTSERGTNVLDSGAPYYDVYVCADGRYVSVAAIEPKFFKELLRRLDLDPATFPPQNERARWAEAREILARIFRSLPCDEWVRRLQGSDACFAPVLTLAEAPLHPQYAARGSFVDVEGITQPAPTPRFSATPAATPLAPPEARVHAPEEALSGWLPAEEIADLKRNGAFD